MQCCQGPGGSTRVALIRLWDPGSLSIRDENGSGPFVDGLLAAERKHELETEIIDLFPRRPPTGGFDPGSQADVDRLSARLRSGDFDLVLWPLGLPGPRFFDVVAQYPDTQFVFLDYCCAKGGRAQRCSQCHCAEPTRRPGRPSRRLPERPDGGPASTVHKVVDTSSRSSAESRASHNSRSWFKGSQPECVAPCRAWRSAATTRIEYDDQTICERIANRQIDAGSGVVFATAGDCALGALSAAAIRGVWGVASGSDLSHLGSHILASASRALRPPRRAECELVPGGTAAAGWGRRARTRRRRRRARRYQLRRAPADPDKGCARSRAASSAGSAAARVMA